MDWRKLTDRVMKTCVRTFGEKKKAVYLPKNQEPYRIKGIFDRDHAEISPGTNLLVSTNRPVFIVAKSEMKCEPQEQDKILIDDKEYSVIDPQWDGWAEYKLFIHEV